MFRSGLLTSYLELMRAANCVRFVLILLVVRYMNDVNLTIEIKLYTICSSHQLGFEVEKPERCPTFSPFRYFAR